MKIKPTSNWKQLGSDVELDANVEYAATWATNQPRWRTERKVFAEHPDGSMLLKRGDYVITECDEPGFTEDACRLFREWLSAVSVPNDPPELSSGEEGVLTLNDSAMLQLIEKTTNFIKSHDQCNSHSKI